MGKSSLIWAPAMLILAGTAYWAMSPAEPEQPASTKSSVTESSVSRSATIVEAATDSVPVNAATPEAINDQSGNLAAALNELAAEAEAEVKSEMDSQMQTSGIASPAAPMPAPSAAQPMRSTPTASSMQQGTPVSLPPPPKQ